ncbi:MAG: aldehyde ferredoxin oxidoreductase family protein [Spirochaetales bacterium]|nr:aldehyde ferredoxin oxidoreductase family protein [Spirochaetales bacterium]
MKGVMGKILKVNLTAREWSEEQIDEGIYDQFLGGIGLATYILHRDIQKGADPLGPENVLGFVPGALTGTGSFVTGRFLVTGKSPLTGGWGDSNCGGNFSPGIKQAGYDGIFFYGTSSEPVYLFIDNKGPQILDASEYWGTTDAVDTEQQLIEKHTLRKKPVCVTIGEAAEKLSLISGIVNDKGRIAARSGLGAVMGSKKLKAVVLAGSKKIPVAKPDKMKEISTEYANKVRVMNLPGFVKGSTFPLVGKALGLNMRTPMNGIAMVGIFKKYGTIFANLSGLNGDLPVKNWALSTKHFKKKAKKTNPDLQLKKETNKYHCSSCNIGCGGEADISNIGDGAFKTTHKPEYETVASFGSLLLSNDLDGIYYINEICNRAGLDTISAGNTMAYAYECYEKGIITKEDTGGLELKWGQVDTAIEVLKQMIRREGFGALLADGVKAATRKIPGSEDCAMHAGGQEPGMHDPRFESGMGLHMSVDPTPGKHTVGAETYYMSTAVWNYCSWAPKQKLESKSHEQEATHEGAWKNVAMSAMKQLVDCSGGCLFAMLTGFNNWRLFDWLNAATGMEKSGDQLMEIGLRVQTMRQMFNIREGIDPWKNKMADRVIGRPPLPDGPTKGNSFDLEGQMQLYWEKIGWDRETGVPTRETLEKLNILQYTEA